MINWIELVISIEKIQNANRQFGSLPSETIASDYISLPDFVAFERTALALSFLDKQSCIGTHKQSEVVTVQSAERQRVKPAAPICILIQRIRLTDILWKAAQKLSVRPTVLSAKTPFLTEQLMDRGFNSVFTELYIFPNKRRSRRQS